MIKIVDYEDKYAKQLSDIILSNLYTINIKDYGKEIINKIAGNFTETAIKESFPKREKCFVALDNEIVVGTASFDRFKGDETGKKYIILTVFVNPINHHQGIGKILINTIENYAKKMNVKEIIIPSSIYAYKFYEKLGYNFLNDNKKLNEKRQYMMVKYYN